MVANFMHSNMCLCPFYSLCCLSEKNLIPYDPQKGNTFYLVPRLTLLIMTLQCKVLHSKSAARSTALVGVQYPLLSSAFLNDSASFLVIVASQDIEWRKSILI